MASKKHGNYVICIEDSDGDCEYYWLEDCQSYSEARSRVRKIIKEDYEDPDYIDSVVVLSTVDDMTEDAKRYLREEDE